MRALRVVALALLVPACVSSSRTAEDYRLKAANTAESTVSALNTARLGVQAAVRGRATGNYLSVLIGEAERDAGSVQAAFLAVQPPNATADAIRTELDALLTEANGLLADLRIATRRGELHRLGDFATRLESISSRLEEFEEQPG